ncbi:guanylate kinase [mine drainage metagenome]|uniref:Guanylate kinase n=1 Tax=mine drainage metagenome TaxID=410659 RepID=T1D4E9_9ZZZZ
MAGMTGDARVFILSAPSGTGKTTVIRALLDALGDQVFFSVSATTRPPRPSERDGVDYFFWPLKRFEDAIQQGDFLEYATVYGQYYGTPQEPVMHALKEGRQVLLDIDWQGARQVRRRLPSVVTIFLLPPSQVELERRLRGRQTEAQDQLCRRLKDAAREIRHWRDFDHVVVNDEIKRTVLEIRTILDNPDTAPHGPLDLAQRIEELLASGPE